MSQLGTIAISDRQRIAVAHLAKGLIDAKIALAMGGQTNVGVLLKSLGHAMGARTPSGLVTKFIDSLDQQERGEWTKWARSMYSYLRRANPRQRRLMAAMGERTAGLLPFELASYLRISEEELNSDLGTLIGWLPGIETRAGLAAVCYLMRQRSPVPSVEQVQQLTLRRPHLLTLRLVAYGLQDDGIVAECGENAGAVKYRIKLLRTMFGLNRTQLGFVYRKHYQPATERLAWQNKTSFTWPDDAVQYEILGLLTSWGSCSLSNDELGELAFLSGDMAQEHIRRLYDRLEGWPRTREALICAATLHPPA